MLSTIYVMLLLVRTCTYMVRVLLYLGTCIWLEFFLYMHAHTKKATIKFLWLGIDCSNLHLLKIYLVYIFGENQ